jgi:nucleoside-diphosphate kinase
MDEEHARALGELATGTSSKSSAERSSLVVVKPSGMAHLGAILDVLCEKK